MGLTDDEEETYYALITWLNKRHNDQNSKWPPNGRWLAINDLIEECYQARTEGLLPWQK